METSIHYKELWSLYVLFWPADSLDVLFWSADYTGNVSDGWQYIHDDGMDLVLLIELVVQDLPYFFLVFGCSCLLCLLIVISM